MSGKRLIYLLLITMFLSSCVDETEVQGLKIIPTALSLSVGDSYQIEMIMEPLSSTIYTVTAWSSSDESVATVDDDGVVTAVYAGECLIKAQAMYYAEYCYVTVTSPTYAMTCTDAIIFDYGDVEKSRVNNLILRLYNSDLTMDSTGSVVGEGTFLNLSLYSSITDDYIEEGNYTVSENVVSNTVQKGEIYSSDGTYYVRGSYLGQYSDYGLSVILINGGYATIAHYNDIYNIKCLLDGADNERISISYAAEPKYYMVTEAEHTDINYTYYNLEQFEVELESTLTHKRLIFNTQEGIDVELYLRTPISSAGFLPQGSYSMSEAVQSFTLMNATSDYPCTITIDGQVKLLVSGTLIVSLSDTDSAYSFLATFVDEDGNQYTMQ